MPRDRSGAPEPPQLAVGTSTTRVGIGYDSHRFTSRRPLILGGVLIPDVPGLEGHSDADAISHAITDAILGAAGLGDIGEMFPDSAVENKDRHSIGMLEAAVLKLSAAGYEVGQVDVSVIAEVPRLSAHRDAILRRLATALGIDSTSVSVKGKTNEGMGWIGRKEGLACIAVATINRKR
ncbi:MAG TPA: 2-C-methyl-D-erythritol 2,4-cyclodiphosphate synthase [Gemmatimonadaceae bacterium]|nr:2-C-methyl-D-erythritol 2,4-cyclodiphosphate synthase [Gemmatimonadaceae bacterium]